MCWRICAVKTLCGVTAKRCVLAVASPFLLDICVFCVFSGSSMGKLNLTCAVVSDGYVIIETKMCFWDIILIKCFITREVFAFDYKNKLKTANLAHVSEWISCVICVSSLKFCLLLTELSVKIYIVLSNAKLYMEANFLKISKLVFLIMHLVLHLDPFKLSKVSSI